MKKTKRPSGRTKFHKQVFSNSPMNVYERMYHAFGNEEIFWEWFWELMLARFSEDLEDLEEETQFSPRVILLSSFYWSLSAAGYRFWSSLTTTLQKEEALCRP